MSHGGLSDLGHRPESVSKGHTRGSVSESKPETVLASSPSSGRISVPQLPSSGSRWKCANEGV